MPVCPQCQSAYTDGQKFCQECGASLAGAGAPPGPAPGRLRQVLPLVGLAAAGLLLSAIFWLLGGNLPWASKPAALVPQGETAARPPEGADLKEQVQTLLNTLREAQLKKDLNLFMGCYSPAFPGLAEKRQKTQKAWEDMPFTNMFYFLDEVTATGPDKAVVRVTWELQAQDRRTQETLSATQAFRVELQRQGGVWRIVGLEEIPAP